jgi:ferrous iron transport protein C
MASLIQVRDMLAAGRMEAKQLSLSLHTPQPMIDAMLENWKPWGKPCGFRKMQGCLSGSCKSCPEGKACLQGVVDAALIKPGIAARLYHITYRRPRLRVRFWSVFLHW